MVLVWPDGLDEASFRADYWQRRPRLLRQLLPDFDSPIDPDELAGLAVEPDAMARLIECIDGDYRLEHGPFDAERFATLPERDWSLLVTDIDKQLPELLEWIEPFIRIAPAWRFDDLMISYAPDGASVGAHVDQYDVFLLQATGQRRWSIDARLPSAYAQRAAGDLRLIDGFEPTDNWLLDPGDVLYLPPGLAHHGVAVGEQCTTWSIGFRAPSRGELVLAIAERVARTLDEQEPVVRLTDSGAGSSEAAVDAATVRELHAIWKAATALDEATIASWAPELLDGE